MSEALIIGGNGFIGSHLVDALSARGHQVSVFDAFRVPPQYRAAGVRRVQGDFMDIEQLDAALSGIDDVFHFLSTTTPATADGDPATDIKTNIIQTVRLLERCVARGIRHVYFSSTGGAIYGPSTQERLTESAPTRPISPYGIAKLAIENYLGYFRVRHGLESTALRISNPYGTRQNPRHKQGLIPIVLRALTHGEQVTRIGDGSMVRDYILVDDAVQLIARMVDRPAQGSTYNIGSGRGYSVNEVFDSIRHVTGIDFTPVEVPVPATFVDHVVLDTRRYLDDFGPVRLTPLREGIERTWVELQRCDG
ncbi:NAD-dependent epimerase/dehydratase family protein [Blastococcus sp. Marseille-P5729]|uniref:NAD-dependent epimerase/dehydratase family protein n=1 Tax=Blastococcus sp. Marseille-P5729 TaxID=2086582 RepID=UPI000D113C28|nr:NAD-dependent epimerase/dehydratase family protein [Blastococcus sp. Marseille-P5729]